MKNLAARLKELRDELAADTSHDAASGQVLTYLNDALAAVKPAAAEKKPSKS